MAIGKRRSSTIGSPSRSRFNTSAGFNGFVESAKAAAASRVEIIKRQGNILKENALNAAAGSLKELRSNVLGGVTNGIVTNINNAVGSDNVFRSRKRVSQTDPTVTASNPRIEGMFMSKPVKVEDPDAVKVDHTNTIANVIGLSQLAQIGGLPPISDSVVDPPPTLTTEELDKDIVSWSGSGLVGKEYVDRVLLRGQFLVLVPIELKAMLGNVILNSNVAGNILDALWQKPASEIQNFLDSIDNRLGVSTYGYSTKVNHRRYWLAVGTHMKVVLHCLGIDPLDMKLMSDNRAYSDYLRNFLPDFILDKIFSNGNWVGVPAILGAGGDDSKITFAGFNDTKDSLLNAGLKTLKNKINTKDKNGNIDRAGISTAHDELHKYISEKMSSNKMSEKQAVASGFFGTFGALGIKNAKGHRIDDPTDASPISLYNASYANILNAVTNLDINEDRTWNLPFITFYCNGPIERSLNFSLVAEKSKIGETITDVGAKTAKGLLTLGSTLATTLGKDWGGNIVETAANNMKSAIESGEDLIKELVYHNGAAADTLDTLITNTYVPKVVVDGSTSQSFTANIRVVAAGSDKYSQARMFWPLCQLLPMVLQKTKSRHPMIIPTNPMYCAAFSKGVMNCPRAYISSMSVKTDPAFQTTNGIPLELDISITIEPLYTITTMPDFTDAWGGVGDINLLNAMWNPMSSFNMIATLSGANTVLSRVPSNVFKFFIGAAVQDAFSTFRSVFSDHGGYFGTYLRDWRRSFDLEDNYSYIS